MRRVLRAETLGFGVRAVGGVGQNILFTSSSSVGWGPGHLSPRSVGWGQLSLWPCRVGQGISGVGWGRECLSPLPELSEVGSGVFLSPPLCEVWSGVSLTSSLGSVGWGQLSLWPCRVGRGISGVGSGVFLTSPCSVGWGRGVSHLSALCEVGSGSISHLSVLCGVGSGCLSPLRAL